MIGRRRLRPASTAEPVSASRSAWSGSPGNRRRVVAAEENAEIRLPRPNLGVVGAGKTSVDLRHVVEVMHGPRREELAQRHIAERGVETLTVEVALAGQRIER